MDHNADKRASSTESQSGGGGGSSAGTAETVAPLATEEDETEAVSPTSPPAPPPPPQEQPGGEKGRSSVSPLSEAAAQVVDELTRGSADARDTTSPPHTQSTNDPEKPADESGREETPSQRDGQTKSPSPTETEDGKLSKSPSGTSQTSLDADMVRIAGVQLGALKTLGALMTSPRYIELLLVPKTDLVDEEKPEDSDSDKSDVRFQFCLFIIPHSHWFHVVVIATHF